MHLQVDRRRGARPEQISERRFLLTWTVRPRQAGDARQRGTASGARSYLPLVASMMIAAMRAGSLTTGSESSIRLSELIQASTSGSVTVSPCI